MRLTCPSCGARYDVDDDLIASHGQHVQCTACHTRWFERPPSRTASGMMGEDEIIARLEARGGALPRGGDAGFPRHRTSGDFLWEDRGDEEAPDDAAPHLRLVGNAAPEGGRGAADPRDPEHPSEPAGQEAPGGTGQAESTLEDRGGEEAEPAGPAAEKAAEPPGAREPELETTADRGARRRLELERPAAAPREDEAPPVPAARRGAMGLAIALVVLVLLAAIYLAAGELARAVPALEPVLGSYAGAVEQARAAIGTGLGLGTEPD